MAKPDDSSLQEHELYAVEAKAKKLLDEANAWGRFPTPVPDILDAAKLRVAPIAIHDVETFLAYVAQKTAAAGHRLKSALSKVLGVYDADEQFIHIDPTVTESKQTFLKLHETGHHRLPSHRQMFKFFQDCEQTLAPSIADLFEREANNFARFTLFQGDSYKQHALDMANAIKTPMALAKQYGASIYASCREFVRTHDQACALFVLEPIQIHEDHELIALVRRIELSPAYLQQFGRPDDSFITLSHTLGRLLPKHGRRMVIDARVHIRDLNGTLYECLGEAFDTKHNVFLLIFPLRPAVTFDFLLPK